MPETCDLPATTLRWIIGDKKLSPFELLDGCIGRVEATNPALNTLVVLCLRAVSEQGEDANGKFAKGNRSGGSPKGGRNRLKATVKEMSLGKMEQLGPEHLDQMAL